GFGWPAAAVQRRQLRRGDGAGRSASRVLPGLPEGSRRDRKKLTEAARLMARGQLILNPQAEEATSDSLLDAFAALGLQCEEEVVLDDEFWLWPENEETLWLWAGLQTQWNAGMGGATGLNYAGVESYLRMLDI